MRTRERRAGVKDNSGHHDRVDGVVLRDHPFVGPVGHEGGLPSPQCSEARLLQSAVDVEMVKPGGSEIIAPAAGRGEHSSV